MRALGVPAGSPRTGRTWVFGRCGEPKTLTIGQLSESWQHLEDLLAHQDGALGYHLVWLADIIRAIGQDATG
ncbi:hypothetical protein [Streptomyces sp. NPDC051162]|uniref:hypothetical protein n=1 Tax=Streptomyces sp. NPDC051162 TaxID=3154747 RepID=UPI00341E6BF9